MSIAQPELWIGGFMFASLLLYTLTGGADFGGGVWDLFASGPRADAQRRLIAHAIGPIWEANHVWLIVVIVLLFSAFSGAFGAISTALHIPLLVMLVGIVLRGTAFVFRAYDPAASDLNPRWNLTFAIASVITPISLGITLGAVCSDRIRIGSDGVVQTNFVSEWLAPFPIAVGVWTLAICAYLAAVYLCAESDDGHLQADFRQRALISGGLVVLLAPIVFWLAGSGAPRLRANLVGDGWAIATQGLGLLAAVGALLALRGERFRLAQTAAIAEVTAILSGWALAQYPYLLYPQWSLTSAAAPRSVLLPVLVALLVGSLLIIPAFAYLYLVFKRR